MLIIEKNTICLTRGDDAAIECAATTADGAEYEMQAGDSVVLTVREKPDASSAVRLQVRSTPGSARIVLRGADTRGMAPGKYSADVQLDTQDGRHYTIWPRLSGINRYSQYNLQNFILMPEVTIE